MHIHWKTKVAIQVLLSHIPGGEAINHRLRLLNGRHTVDELRENITGRLIMFSRLQKQISLRGATVVEIGSGWELLDPLLMFVFGAARIYTYDRIRHARFAVVRRVVRELQTAARSLVEAGADPLRLEALAKATNLTELMALARIDYMAPGDASATGLPDCSVDLFFSVAVLEHVAPSALSAIVAECRRVLKSSGRSFHVIDPGDHYWTHGVSRINFLQYSDRAWNFWVQNSISYHNRLRAKEFLDAFSRGGLSLIYANAKTEASGIELLRNGFRLDCRFARFSPEELAVSSLEVVHGVSEKAAEGSVTIPE